MKDVDSTDRHDEYRILSHSWGWFLASGILSLLLGIICLAHVVEATIISVLFLGAALFVAGIFQIFQSFTTHRWSGFFLHVLTGILYGAVGFMILSHPDISAMSLTPLIAALAITAGLFRMGAAFALFAPHAGWTALNGILSLLLGLYVWWTWPVSSFFLLGVIVGVELLINSVPLIQLGIYLRTLDRRSNVTHRPSPVAR
jgi:uncharacterized membrane protein HdeD (DUF308 family)